MTRMGLGGLAIALSAVAALGAQGTQSAPSANAQPPAVSLSGRVVDGVTGKPIAGASLIVELLGQRTGRLNDPKPAAATSNASGTFSISGASAGRLRLTARKDGYLDGRPDQLGPGDEHGSGFRWADLANGESVTDIVIKLWQSATVRGVITDDVGDPLVGATVQLMRKVYLAGDVTLERTPGLGIVRTDDRGRYQISNVSPGDYFVVAPSPAMTPVPRVPAHPTVFYPASPNVAGATALHVESGAVLDGINMTLNLSAPPRPMSVSGRLIGPADVVGSIPLRLIKADSPDAMAQYEAMTTAADTSGRFRFPNLEPGRYRILVSQFPRADGAAIVTGSLNGFGIYPVNRELARLPDLPTWWADVPVTLEGQDVVGLEVPLATGGRIRGRVVFEGGSPRPTDEQLLSSVVLVRPARGLDIGRIPQARVEADGSFASIGLPPGLYGISWVGLLAGIRTFAYNTSARVGGIERLGAGVEVGVSDVSDVVMTFSDRGATLTGTVIDGLRRPVSSARVIVFPRDPDLRRHYLIFPSPRLVYQVEVDRLGRFTEARFPGDLLVAAVSSVPENWMTPEFLQTLVPFAVPAKMVAGETTNVTVPVRDVR